MKLGFVSAILPDLSLAEVVEFAAEAGFECVELMCWPISKAERRYAGVTHVDVTAMDDAAAGAVRRTVGDAGIEISALGYYPNPLTPDAQDAATYVQHLRKVIAAAARLGIGRMNTFVGRDASRTIDQNWPRLLEVWGPLVEFAEQQQVRIGIENCPMLYTRDEWPGGHNLAYCPAVWRRMFQDLPSPCFGLNYDPSHLVWQQIDPVAPLREFAERLVHVHAKDVRIDRERLNQVGILATPLEYHTPKLPGLGEIDWGRFFSTLGDVGYRGPVCIEVEDRAYEASLDSRKAALRQSAGFLRNFMAEGM
ncbi:MAG: sugar phosphate isomerase/epimerase [Planctomycetes bacterium]|nr:sugar phosphate isomerase/epimerase [Planctomycetota bacterium]